MKLLQAGQNIVLEQLNLQLVMRYPTNPNFKSELDVSLFLLNASGVVRGDDDFYFYNHPTSSDGSIALQSSAHHASIALDLHKIPSDVHKIMLTIVIDGQDTLQNLQYLTCEVQGIAKFEVDTQGRSEKALMVMEFYRHNQNWKVRAQGQGFNGGLEPLAKQFGVDVSAPETNTVPQSNVEAKPRTISLEKKLEEKAPHLVSLAKNVTVSLKKHQLENVQARVAFVLDASGSMTREFKKGHVQSVLDRIAVLAVQFDDDGDMDMWGFADRHKKYPDVTLENLRGYVADIQSMSKKSRWEILPGLGGSNNEPPVMNEIIDYFKDSDLPVFVVFITDGGISKTRAIKKAISRSADYPIFWKFVGLGGSNYGVLEDLDDFTDRRLDNTNFFAIDNFERFSDETLYDLLLVEFKDWYNTARTAGIMGRN